MKKEIGAIAVGSILMISTLFSGCGFFSDREGLEYESDGQFHYYGGENGYAIIGEEDNLPETVYVPSHYKGKEIVSYKTRYTPPSTIGDGHEIYYHLYLKDVKRVYFPYNCDSTYFDWSQPVGSKSLTEQFYASDGFGLRSFIERADDLYSLLWPEVGTGKFFVRREIYEKCISEISEFNKEYNGKNDFRDYTGTGGDDDIFRHGVEKNRQNQNQQEEAHVRSDCSGRKDRRNSVDQLEQQQDTERSHRRDNLTFRKRRYKHTDGDIRRSQKKESQNCRIIRQNRSASVKMNDDRQNTGYQHTDSENSQHRRIFSQYDLRHRDGRRQQKLIRLCLALFRKAASVQAQRFML